MKLGKKKQTILIQVRLRPDQKVLNTNHLLKVKSDEI